MSLTNGLRTFLSKVSFRFSVLRPGRADWVSYEKSGVVLGDSKDDSAVILSDGKEPLRRRQARDLAVALDVTGLDMACGPIYDKGRPDRVVAAGYELGMADDQPVRIPLLEGEALRRRWARAVTTAYRPSGRHLAVKSGVLGSIVEEVGSSERDIVAELRNRGPWAVAWGAAHEGVDDPLGDSMSAAVDRRDHGAGQIYPVEPPGPRSPGTPCPPPAAIWVGEGMSNRFPGLDERVLTPTVAVRHAATDWGVAERWGDHHFARGLANAFADVAVGARVAPRHVWAHPFAARELVITLRGLVPAPPVHGRTNVLWVISHPRELQTDEFDGYDLVAVASESDRTRIASMINAPVITLLQATMKSDYRPPGSPDGSVIFVGNSRGVRRRAVGWAIEQGLPLHVYGQGWDGLEGNNVQVFGPIDRGEVSDRFNSASVVLGDHWDDMRELGYVSNRVFDVAAAGGLLISDRVDGIDRLLPGVPTFESAEGLGQLVRKWLEVDRHTRQAHIEELQGTVLERHTFARRVEQLFTGIREHVDGGSDLIGRLLHPKRMS